jgi:hypothetical protein
MKKFVLFLAVGLTLFALSANAAVGVGSCTVIDRPGSYARTTNIKATPAQLKTPGPACILILADFVTLDLGGFSITGPGAGFGVYSTAGPGHYLVGTLVTNGIVTNFHRGIALEGAGQTAEKVRVKGNGVWVTLDGIGMKVNGVQAFGNATAGVLCFSGSGNTVQDSVITSGNGDGINLNACSARNIIGNTVVGNGGYGITATCPSLIIQNMASQNSGGDIFTDLPAPACTRNDKNPVP